ncbi:MAG: porin, partial [Chitinophagaceae bacterium]
LLGAILWVGIDASAQESKPSNFTISGYMEAYYSYEFNKPLNNMKPGFLYSHNRGNEINLNLGFVKATYTTDRVRGNLALATGTYMNANYAAEPGVLKNIYEGNVGVKLSAKRNIWLDAGILPSHIGWESAVGKDCPTLTRSLAAENSPYFETGVKLGYTSSNEKWYLSALVLNGWQRIQRVDGNTTPAFGTQVTYKPSAKVTLNSSSFIGNDKADSVKQMRYFHDFYGIFQLGSKFSAVAGFDIGAEQKSKGSSTMHTWYTPVVIIKYTAFPKTIIALRGEYYSDKNGVIIATGSTNGFKTWGFSGNIDYSITSNAMWRVEIRNLNSRDGIFIDAESKAVQNNVSLSTSIAISF